MPENTIKLSDVKREEVPQCLKPEHYFDFESHPFDHAALVANATSVIDVLDAIHGYAVNWLDRCLHTHAEGKQTWTDTVPGCLRTSGRFRVILEEGAVFRPSSVVGVVKPDKAPLTVYLAKGAVVSGSTIYLTDGHVFIGEDSLIEPGAGIKGPAIIGRGNEIRQGAYLRGDVITGGGGVFRGEIKNAVMMDKTNFPHPSYVGDSLCGYATHFGNQATSANLGIFEGIREPKDRQNIVLNVDGRAYDTGRRKIGIILGDYSQVGCNSVSDPGTFLGPYTVVYALTRISKGFYGPNEILKNKPLEHGIVERASFRA